MGNLTEEVDAQIEAEFREVTGFALPELLSANTIVLNGRRFTDRREYLYYIANRMWDTFDEILAETKVEVAYDDDEDEGEFSPCCGAEIVRGDLCSDCLEHCV
jgi:hypothetical protein